MKTPKSDLIVGDCARIVSPAIIFLTECLLGISSATVALLAIPGINGMAQIAGIISVLCAISSVLCGMLLIFNHQDRVETSGAAGVSP